MTLWKDKQAQYPRLAVPLALIGVALLGMGVMPYERILLSVLLALVVGLFFAFHPAVRPIEVRRDGIVTGKRKSIRRCLVPFSEIANMKIKSGITGRFTEDLVITDKKGREYVNVIYGVNDFKRVLRDLKSKVPEVNNESWYKLLPKKLW